MLSPSVRLAICYLLLFFAVLSCLIDFVAIGDGDSAKTTKEARRLQIGVKKRPEVCDTKSRKGDVLHMHYKGTLEDGTEFDNSYKRGDPLSFTLGSGQVIRGWDQGLLAMCAGEKRKLVIPPELAYGATGAPPTIPVHCRLHITYVTGVVKIHTISGTVP
ncbi:hypothetical protein HPB47_013386 [Ixodes persulcatus]|uniref:Uncharacterized protein n=1 Tax=Ixodes persulcatus TaxID=34615 RepID=A0AC60QZF9_IXOPE|nr:hypothetical protein HPB47_013386 [Ixodes persulcatus]